MAKNGLWSKIAGRRTTANVLVLSSLALFLIGIFAPVLTLKKFFVFSSTVSIVGGLFQLLSEGYPLLFLLIFGFSILLPFLKLLLLFGLVNGWIQSSCSRTRVLHWMAHYGKWSMLDVFVAALLIVSVRLSVLADVTLHFGIYAFAASVILTLAAASSVVKSTKPAAHRE